MVGNSKSLKKKKTDPAVNNDNLNASPTCTAAAAAGDSTDFTVVDNQHLPTMDNSKETDSSTCTFATSKNTVVDNQHPTTVGNLKETDTVSTENYNADSISDATSTCSVATTTISSKNTVVDKQHPAIDDNSTKETDTNPTKNHITADPISNASSTSEDTKKGGIGEGSKTTTKGPTPPPPPPPPPRSYPLNQMKLLLIISMAIIVVFIFWTIYYPKIIIVSDEKRHLIAAKNMILKFNMMSKNIYFQNTSPSSIEKVWLMYLSLMSSSKTYFVHSSKFTRTPFGTDGRYHEMIPFVSKDLNIILYDGTCDNFVRFMVDVSKDDCLEDRDSCFQKFMFTIASGMPDHVKFYDIVLNNENEENGANNDAETCVNNPFMDESKYFIFEDYLILEEERIAEEKRLAEIAKKERIAEEKRLAEIAKKERIAEEKRLAEIAKKERIAEEKRLAEIAKKERIAEEKRLAEIAKKERIAEEKRLAEIAKKERIAEKKRLAEIAKKERIAEEERLARANYEDEESDSKNRLIREILTRKPIDIVNQNLAVPLKKSEMYPHFNFGIFGKHGVGKSTLLRSIVDYSGGNPDLIDLALGVAADSHTKDFFEIAISPTVRMFDIKGLKELNDDGFEDLIKLTEGRIAPMCPLHYPLKNENGWFWKDNSKRLDPRCDVWPHPRVEYSIHAFIFLVEYSSNLQDQRELKAFIGSLRNSMDSPFVVVVRSNLRDNNKKIIRFGEFIGAGQSMVVLPSVDPFNRTLEQPDTTWKVPVHVVTKTMEKLEDASFRYFMQRIVHGEYASSAESMVPFNIIIWMFNLGFCFILVAWQ